MYRYVVHVSR